MFPQVQSALGDLVATKLITITESVPDKSDFLLHHFISNWLSQDSKNKVLILGIEQSFGHYHGVAMKLGLNLVKLRQSGRVLFYEGLKKIPVLLEDSDNDLEIMKKVYDEVGKMVGDYTLVIVDQVTILSIMGFSVKSVYGLCHYLTSLIDQQTSSQLIIRMFEDAESRNPIVHLVSRVSMLNIYVEGLSTGLSRDVSGTIRLKCQNNQDKSLQFKLLEKDVKVFALGTSQNVL